MKRRNATRSGAVCRLGLIGLLSAALWPLNLRAETQAGAPIERFVIGVWSPAGWSGARHPSSYDRFFTQSDADALADLGVNLLVQTPRVGNRDIWRSQETRPMERDPGSLLNKDPQFRALVGNLVIAHDTHKSWASRLTRARGVIQAVNSHRLLAVAENAQSQRIDLARIQTLSLGETSVSLSASRDTVQALTEPVDSLAAKEMHRPLLSHRGYRLPAKVAAGTGWGIVFAGMAIGVHASVSESTSPHHGIGVFLNSAAIGCSVGFPLGVSSVDGYDSLLGTLLAGVIPTAAGIGMIAIDQEIDQERLGTALLLTYVAPVLGSLMVSEIWRNPPEDRGASFGLAPTFNGGFSGVTTLRL